MYKKHLIEGVNSSKKESGEHKYYKCGLLIGGNWYNQNIFDAEVFFMIEKNKSFYVNLFQETYEGKEYSKFRLPSYNQLIYLQQSEILEGVNSLLADAGVKLPQLEDYENSEPVNKDDLPF